MRRRPAPPAPAVTGAPVAARRRFIALAAAALPLAGCGFQLRGVANLPYETLYVSIPDSNPMGVELKRNLRSGTKTRVVANREDAEAILTPFDDLRTKTILSLSSSGRVREFKLRYSFGFRVTDVTGQDIIRPVSLVIERDFAFNDNQVLAKESEEALIFRDMQSDMVQQVLRRLEASQRLPANAN